jgi:NAD(P)H-dependent FMN reductase
VLKWVLKTLDARAATCGSETVKHEVTLYDPIEVFGEGGALASSGAQLSKPHFYHASEAAPPAMEAMRESIKAADDFIIVSAECE